MYNAAMDACGLNILRPRQIRRHFPDDSFKCVSLNENVLISIIISLNLIPIGPVINIPSHNMN